MGEKKKGKGSGVYDRGPTTKRPKGTKKGSTVESSIAVAERAYVFGASVQGYSIARMAAESHQHLGYPLGLVNCGRRLKEAQREVAEATLADGIEKRATEAEKLDALEVRLRRDLSAVVLGDDGRPLLDDDGAMIVQKAAVQHSAAGLLLRLFERRAKLLGLDAPAQVEVAHSVVDPADIELRRIIDEARATSDAPYPMKETP
jgi:hypothetical protein